MGQASVQQVSFTSPQAEQLSPEEVEQLLSQLETLCSKLSVAILPRPRPEAEETALDGLVKNILRSRGRRNRLFGNNLFGEPAWDILLELYAAERSERKLSVSGASYASAAPHSTGLRWIHRLERDGWIRRIDDPADHRRSWVELTEEASARMREILCDFAARVA